MNNAPRQKALDEKHILNLHDFTKILNFFFSINNSKIEMHVRELEMSMFNPKLHFRKYPISSRWNKLFLR